MPVKEDKPRVVLTASRRSDLVRWYPKAILRALHERYPPARVHTIVLISKFPGAVLAPSLLQTLSTYDQCTAQITITGWGGTDLEPAVPEPSAALADLPPLLDFLGHPARLRLRIDPLLRLSDGRDNVEAAMSIMSRAAAHGVTDFITSIVTPYPKIEPRLAKAGLSLRPWSPDERQTIIASMADAARSLGGSLAGCCLPELPGGACIDGRLLSRLHPAGLPCRLDHPTGQRQGCGCSHSIDLGWYSSHPCFSGCLYCYANPRPASS